MVPENWKVRMEMLRYLARVSGEGPPSVREVGEAVGLRSSQTAYKHLKKLEEAGYVERGNRRARGIRLGPNATQQELDAASQQFDLKAALDASATCNQFVSKPSSSLDGS